jgi:HAD superfamily hydrolase (TIGR01509 family)
MKFDAILWDCDGVLIDSELLACGVSAEFYSRAGFPLTAADYMRRFIGLSRAQIADTIRREKGADLAAAIDWSGADAARRTLFEAELKAIAGIEGLLAKMRALELPMAIGSGSSPARLEHSLKLVDLWDVFAPHVYSSEQVARGKPAPDIYLFAAEQLGVAAGRCLVIEDGLHGTHAGKAAGMIVYGFTGGSHCTADTAGVLREAGADAVFADVAALRAALMA